MDQLLQFGGRLHPLVLHTPIGFAIALVLLEILFLIRRKPLSRDIRAPLAWLTAASAVLAVASGLLLHEEGGYDAQTVQLHQWLSIAVGVCCLAAAVAQQIKRTKAYALALVAAMALIIPAGHFGATMTHGENFLFEPFGGATVAQAPVPVPPIPPAPPGSVFAASVAPILQTYCYGCHGPGRDKGQLRLHTPEAILAGGDLGPALVPGKPDESELLRRIVLPVDDEDHMPPASKPQPTAEEVAALRTWIASGAKFDGAPAATGSGVAQAEKPRELPMPDAGALADIRAKLAHVEPVARDSRLLLVDFSAVAPTIDDKAIAVLLAPIREHVADLNLSRTRIGDDALVFIAGLPNLRRLNLSSTAITERGLDSLADHAVLADLVLTQTKLTDSAFDSLTALPALAHLYVWNSGLTPETIADLRKELPKVEIDAGDSPDSIALATETEVKLGSAAKPNTPPATGAAPSAEQILKPVNTTCPVAGTPIDAEFAIVYKGRVIAFCCRHCVGKFLEDPAKYEDKIQ